MTYGHDAFAPLLWRGQRQGLSLFNYVGRDRLEPTHRAHIMRRVGRIWKPLARFEGLLWFALDFEYNVSTGDLL
jgi:hypothetical protein